MSHWPQIWAFLTGKPFVDPRAEWEAAKARYEQAVRRGDTRAQHDAWPALREATNRLLRTAR